MTNKNSRRGTGFFDLVPSFPRRHTQLSSVWFPTLAKPGLALKLLFVGYNYAVAKRMTHVVRIGFALARQPPKHSELTRSVFQVDSFFAEEQRS